MRKLFKVVLATFTFLLFLYSDMVTRPGTETVTDRINNRTLAIPLPPLTFSFNTGGTDSGTSKTNLTCRATGEMEKALIDLLVSSYTQ